MGKLIHEELSYKIIGAAMEVHTVLGPGFLEKVYENALAQELKLRGLSFAQQVNLPVKYKGVVVGHYVADIVVENKIVLELKTVKQLNKQHQAQAINYLTATGLELALLLNYGLKSLERMRIVSKRNLQK